MPARRSSKDPSLRFARYAARPYGRELLHLVDVEHGRVVELEGELWVFCRRCAALRFAGALCGHL